ncbi:hypothetical protein [Gemmatimonas sp.]|uniref:hypothetical protein n=1 Tax=Gemmatimonas sp. TaxID=1962908 RepID=UPI0039832792
MIRVGHLVRVRSRAYHRIDDGSERCAYLLVGGLALIVDLRIVPDGYDNLVVVQGHRRVLVPVPHAETHLQGIAAMPTSALASLPLARSCWAMHLAAIGRPVTRH